jgi:8-oxo-dGTP diphosphatase
MEMQVGQVVGAGVMIVRQQRVLLGRRLSLRGLGTFGWCGGKVEENEGIVEAAIRETYEETGLRVSNLKLLSVAVLNFGERRLLDFEFLAGDVLGTPELREPSQVESWNWYHLDALPTPLFPSVTAALIGYRSGKLHIDV